jgi:hypothetical protein
LRLAGYIRVGQQSVFGAVLLSRRIFKRHDIFFRVNIMALKIIALTAAITLASATSAFAATLDFGFSFGTGASEVTGTIIGLEDDTAGSVLLDVTILGSPFGPLDGAFGLAGGEK